MAFLAPSPMGTRTWTRAPPTIDRCLSRPAVPQPCRRRPPCPRATQQPPPSPSEGAPPAAPPATLAALLALPFGHPGIIPAAGSPLGALLDCRTRLGDGTRLVCVYAGGPQGGGAGGGGSPTSDPAAPPSPPTPPAAAAPSFSAAAFHAATNLGGVPSLLVATDADGGGVWGGYNPVGWDSRDDYRDSLVAFLFREPPPGSAEAVAGAAAVAEASAAAAAAAAAAGGGGGVSAVAAAAAAWGGGDGSILVADKAGGSGAAVFDFADWAVRWGSDALAMPMNDAKGLPEDRAVSVLGTQYGLLPGGGRTVFGGGRSSVSVRSLRVYVSEQWAPKAAPEGDKPSGGGLFGRLFGR